ncbi:MAG: amidohydrolase family protein [Planctomycetota bacterium]
MRLVPRQRGKLARAALVAAAQVALFCAAPAVAQVAVHGQLVYTLTGPPIVDGVVVVVGGKIAAIGKLGEVPIPADFELLHAALVTPGLVDAHSVVGLAGQYNQARADQDQHEGSEAIQPELRAIDAYNPRERLVSWVRGFGVTTLQTGHAPEELVPGQLFIVKTTGATADDAAIVPFSAVAATLAESAKRASAPGTRSKMMAMLRASLIEAREYATKRAPTGGAAPAEAGGEDEDEGGAHGEDASPAAAPLPPRDLRLDALAAVLAREVPLVLTAHRAQDIASALRLAREFDLRLVLDGAAEAYLMLDELKDAGVPVILHPTMQRAVGEADNLSFETAAKLATAGIPFALQSGFEAYVPKTRVVLFEAAIAASHGLGFEAALASITRDAAKILGVDARVGTLEVGKDGDLALYDGDPFEYTSHCLATIIEGKVVSRGERTE